MAFSTSKWLGALLLVAAFCAHAAEPWKLLPPTPTLPPQTVGKHAIVNGARLWYAEWGAGNPGTPVLLLHGGYANSNYFGFLIPVLIKNGYHVIAVDSRGHGRSRRTDEPITYHLMASDFVGLLVAKGQEGKLNHCPSKMEIHLRLSGCEPISCRYLPHGRRQGYSPMGCQHDAAYPSV